MFLWLLFLILIIAAVVWFLRRNDRSGGERPAAGRPPALDVLEERYARGEIERDEYLQKKRDLTG